MNFDEALAYAREQMDHYGLYEWRVVLMDTKRRLGVCRYGKKHIGLSRFHIANNSEEEVINTIKHEIAHALTQGDNHGQKWRNLFISMGGTGKRCTNVTNKPVAKWLLVCPNCGSRSEYYRRPRVGGRACAACCNDYNSGRYSSDYDLVLKKVVLRPASDQITTKTPKSINTSNPYQYTEGGGKPQEGPTKMESTEDLNRGTAIFASDLAKNKQNDAFMGKGFEALLKEAEEKDTNVIVGRFYKQAYLDE